MITNITYNQIIEASRNFAIAHYKLKGSFGNGLLSDKVLHDQLGRFQYYLMYMEDLEMSVEKNLSTFGFRVSFSAPETTLKNQSTDLPSTNFNEIKSDAIKLCMDFLAYWMTATDNDYPTLYVEPNAGIHVYQDLTPDRLAGAYIDIRFKQAFDANSCAIPMSGVGSASNTCDPVFIYENNVLVATIASGGEYRYTSGGGASIDISINTNLIFPGQSTNLDIDVIDSTGGPTGNWNGTEFEIDNSTININTVEMVSTPPAQIVDLLVKKSDGTTNVGSKVGANWQIANSTISNSDDTYTDSVLAEGSLELPDETFYFQIDGVTVATEIEPALSTQTFNINWD